MTDAVHKRRIDVLPGILGFVGPGPIADADWVPSVPTVRFTGLDGAGPAFMTVAREPDRAALAEALLVYAVAPEACLRAFGCVPADDMAWGLSGDLRAMARAVRDCALPEPARSTLRLAKSIQLLCDAFTRFAPEALVHAERVPAAVAFPSGDAARLRLARDLVDERWREALTLDAIARASGLNRAKLTRGFRLLFRCSVGDALAANRLDGARDLLLTTDLPVSAVGYRCGYRSNAGFSRAFARRHGMPPTRLRRAEGTA